MCMYSVHVHVHACSNVHAHDMLCSHNTKSIIALKVCKHARGKFVIMYCNMYMCAHADKNPL